MVSLGPVQADAELCVAEPRGLLLRRYHAADERIARTLVGAVGGVRREAQVHLVRDLEADHAGVGAEAAHHLAHVLDPGVDVALLLGARLVAHLELDRKAVARVLLGERQERAEAALSVAPEEAREPQRERGAWAAQLVELRQLPSRVLRHGL